jgi:hypothetical protein
LVLSIGTRALPFFSQENFFTAIENKIDFFLVGFATDFYSQARWRGQPQSVCE